MKHGILLSSWGISWSVCLSQETWLSLKSFFEISTVFWKEETDIWDITLVTDYVVWWEGMENQVPSPHLRQEWRGTSNIPHSFTDTHSPVYSIKCITNWFCFNSPQKNHLMLNREFLKFLFCSFSSPKSYTHIDWKSVGSLSSSYNYQSSNDNWHVTLYMIMWPCPCFTLRLLKD